MNLIQMAYESNFRASLIDPELQSPVDSDLQLFEEGRDMYFARGGIQLLYFAQSPLAHRRALASRAVENELYFECSHKGCPNIPQMYALCAKGNRKLVEHRNLSRSTIYVHRRWNSQPQEWILCRL